MMERKEERQGEQCGRQKGSTSLFLDIYDETRKREDRGQGTKPGPWNRWMGHSSSLEKMNKQVENLEVILAHCQPTSRQRGIVRIDHMSGRFEATKEKERTGKNKTNK